MSDGAPRPAGAGTDRPRPPGSGGPPAGLPVDPTAVTVRHDGAPSAAAQRVAAPAAIGGYVVERELARGGMGVVYAARSPDLGRRVALKLMLDPLASPDERERFAIEARSAARLRHPGIVGIHHVGQDAGRPYIVMDLIEGRSLADRLKDEGPLPPREAARLTERLASALAYAHQHGVLHRDLKPGNVLVGKDGEPVLTDFGLAKQLDGEARSGLTVTGQVVGTPAYMPPEQAEGRPDLIDRRSDVYGLGATLYALLTGRPPFQGLTAVQVLAAVLGKDPPPPSRLRPGIDRDLETICLACLEKDPARRYSSAALLQEDLARYGRDEAVLARRPSLVERARRWGRRNRGLSAASALFVVALVVVPLVLLRRADAAARARDRERATLAGARASERLAAALAVPLPDAARVVSMTPTERQAALEPGIGAALAALDAAQRWRAMASSTDEVATADAALGRALLRVGDTALRAEQWSLAAWAFEAASGLGLAEGAAGVRDTTQARTAEAERRAARVEALLAAAARGELRRRGEAIDDAVFELVGLADAATRAQLARALAEVTVALRGVERELLVGAAEVTPDEAATGSRTIEGLAAAVDLVLDQRDAAPPEARRTVALADRRLRQREARAARVGERLGRSVLGIIADAQRRRLGGRLDLARVCCEVLGQTAGADPSAEAAVARYLRAEAEQARAAVAGIALCRIGGASGAGEVFAAMDRLGLRGVFATRVQRWIARFTPPVDAAPDARAHVTRARVLLARGEPARALASLDRAVELDPRSADARLRRGLVHNELGDRRRALADLDDAVRLAPQDADVLSTRAFLRIAWGEHAAARPDLDLAISLAPENASGWRLRGQSLCRQGDLLAGLADLERAVNVEPLDARAWFALATARIHAGDAEGTLIAVDRAVELDPDDPEMRVRRGIVRNGRGEFRAAADDLERALDLDPALAEAWAALSRSRMGQGDGPGAIETASRAIELAPAREAGWISRAHARRGMRDLPGARADIDQALAVAPDSPAALAELAALLETGGDLLAARAELDRAAALRPRSWPLAIARGKVLIGLGLFAEAEAAFTQALAVDARNVMALVDRGRARRNLGDLAGSRSDLQRAIELDPHSGEALGALGATLAAGGDRAAAIDAYTRAIGLVPLRVEAWTDRGHTRSLAGDVAGAAADLDHALELDPRFEPAWINRAAHRKRNGDLAGARADLDQAIQLIPTSARAREDRGVLRQATGDLPGAREDLEAAVKLGPRAAQAWINLGAVRSLTGDDAAAEAALDRAIELRPTSGEAFANRAEVRAKRGAFGPAADDAERAVELLPPGRTRELIRGRAEAMRQRAGASPAH